MCKKDRGNNIDDKNQKNERLSKRIYKKYNK